MYLFHTTISTFIYFTFMFCLFPFKTCLSILFSITITNNEQSDLEICTNISDVLVFISNLMT